jgi:hypothetical protein
MGSDDGARIDGRIGGLGGPPPHVAGGWAGPAGAGQTGPAGPAGVGQTGPAGVGQTGPAGGGQTYVAPRSDLERRLARVWRDVLGVDRVGVHDDFFALGGNSLRAVRVAARLATTEALPATAAQIFAAPTIAELSRRLAGAPSPAAPSRIPRLPRQGRRRPATGEE